MKYTKFFASVISVIALVACGPGKVSFDTLETARSQGKSNVEWNAQTYRASNPQFANYSIVAQTDSTMIATCPQGDGWGSVKLVEKTNPALVTGLKCSTVSGSVGCLTDKDFSTKSYAGDDGKCQAIEKVPFPIPKISK